MVLKTMVKYLLCVFWSCKCCGSDEHIQLFHCSHWSDQLSYCNAAPS